MGELHHPPPEALRRRGPLRARDNVGPDQALSLPPGLIADFFGTDLVDRMEARRGRKPRRRRTPKPRNTRQPQLPALEQSALRAAYDRADLARTAGVSFEQACETPALRRCLEIIAAGSTTKGGV